MAGLLGASVKWKFVRPDPPASSTQYFRTDMRRIAGEQTDYNLPWGDNMYLAYPSLDEPDWPAFVEHVKGLNKHSDENTYYKIVYIMRRAHKPHGDIAPDPSIDDEGKQQCAQLSVNIDNAMRRTSLPRPEVIMTSPLTRALETTKLGVACLNPTIRPIVHEGFRERLDDKQKNKRSRKDWIKRNFADFDTENVDADDSLGSKYAKSREPDELRWLRVKASFANLFENFPDALVVALMSHCHVIQTIQREITGFDLKEDERTDKVEFYLGDTGVYAVIVKGERLSSHEGDLAPVTENVSDTVKA